MRLADLGEQGFIRRVSRCFNKGMPPQFTGIGDDCAVLPWKENLGLLVTTDMLVEDVHFLRDHIAAQDLGYKALAVNLSDLAAMGASPLAAFLSLSLPSDLEIHWTDQFFKGWKSLSVKENVLLLGGDTTGSSGKICINVTVLGTAPLPCIKRRSAARAGDIVCVTGNLGDSGAGLQTILKPRQSAKLPMKWRSYFQSRHYRPQPRLEEGRWLSRQLGVHGMMDLSDGLDSDLRQIMEHSRCGARIETTRIPLSPLLKKASELCRWNAVALAVSAGEDYELLVTISASEYPSLSKRFHRKFETPLTAIGEVIKKPGRLLYTDHGKPCDSKYLGFSHF